MATSAVPILATTRSTSGICLIRASRAVCIRMACDRLVPGMRKACMAMSPSSRLGTNSDPIRLAAKPAITTNATAPTTKATRRRSAMARAGS